MRHKEAANRLQLETRTCSRLTGGKSLPRAIIAYADSAVNMNKTFFKAGKELVRLIYKLAMIYEAHRWNHAARKAMSWAQRDFTRAQAAMKYAEDCRQKAVEMDGR